jgi:hypothetical protein
MDLWGASIVMRLAFTFWGFSMQGDVDLLCAHSIIFCVSIYLHR